MAFGRGKKNENMNQNTEAQGRRVTHENQQSRDYYRSGHNYYGDPQRDYYGQQQNYSARYRGYEDSQDNYANQRADGRPNYYGQQGYGSRPNLYGDANNNGQMDYYGDDVQGYSTPSGYYGQYDYSEPVGYYEQNGYYDQGGQQPVVKKKKKHRKLMFILEVVIVLFMAVGIFAFAQLSRVQRIKLSDILVNSGIGQTVGYRNIALFGVDSREGNLEGSTNSDTIMVASINQKTGDIRLVSVYRDTYLDHTNGRYGKATECFASGGAQQAVNMLNKNLDLDITDFVTVDFNGVIEAVDLLGGIELDITEEERGWLNGYQDETSLVTGVEKKYLESAGLQTVNGIQAMAYCRIRYTEGWDFKRTERQRIVLEKIFQKAKEKGVTGLIPLINTMMGYISTSLSNTEMLTLAAGIAKYNIVDTVGFPFSQQSANISAGDCVVPVNLAQNVKELHQYLFNDTAYTPSETVQEISNNIIYETGIQ